ncbi:WGxxGxxG family protein [Cytobacillus firmus]|uniref:WGxxGxxG family protein n=1 Tax=Cytobacillus firmus TaxID=1399 RepID=UPI001C8EEFF0|nr:WGxxGxxG family protein [Cytobacillus firmus]MBX9972526.1 WGxxGxxG-CTERM domain-containing protein [Cytobacillus firmus]
MFKKFLYLVCTMGVTVMLFGASVNAQGNNNGIFQNTNKTTQVAQNNDVTNNDDDDDTDWGWIGLAGLLGLLGLRRRNNRKD